MKHCTPLWREADVQSCPSKNVQSTPCSDHFWKLRCRKSACRCGAKHVSKSKCTKHTILGPLFDVQMSKKWTLTNTFNCTTIHSIALHYNYNSNFTTTTTTTTLHPTTPHCTTLHCTTLRYTTPHYTTLHCAALHYTTLHSTTLHYTTLHYTALHYIRLH